MKIPNMFRDKLILMITDLQIHCFFCLKWKKYLYRNNIILILQRSRKNVYNGATMVPRLRVFLLYLKKKSDKPFRVATDSHHINIHVTVSVEGFFTWLLSIKKIFNIYIYIVLTMEKWAGQSHFKCSSVRGNYKEVLKTLKRYCMSSTAIMLVG